MKNLNSILASVACVLVIGAFTAPAPVWAQGDAPDPIVYRIVDVKPGQEAAAAAVMKEISDAAQAAGWPFYHVYQLVYGPQPGFVITSPDGAFTDLAPLELADGLFTRLGDIQYGNTLLSLGTYPGLSISSGSAAPGGDFLRVRVRTVAPANAAAYLAWQENEMTPAYREAGATDMRFNRVLVGGNINSFVRFTYPSSIVGGESNIAEAVGQREFQEILENEAELIVSAEDYLYTYRRDLSFTGD